MMMSANLNSLNQARQVYNSQNEQISTGMRINRPSDDPSGYSISTKLGAFINQLDQHQKNINFGVADLSRKELAYSSIESPLREIKKELLTAANGTTNEQDKKILSNSIKEKISLIDSLLKSKNENQEFIFSGVDSKNPPYDQNFNINPSEGVKKLRYSQNGEMDISAKVPGGVVDFMKKITEDLNSGTFTSDSIDLLNNAQKEITSERVNFGSKINVLDLTEKVNANFKTNLIGTKSEIDEADIPDVITKLKQSQLAIDANLKLMSQFQNNNLFSYL